METVRAFVGCLLDLSTTRRVVEIQRRVRHAAEGAGWRAAWVPPPNLHVTLKFLGEVDVGLVSPLADALARVAATHGPMRVPVAGLGAFPERGAPRVLFLNVDVPGGPLVSLASAVEEALATLGFPRERRPFHGHVTLARVKDVGTAARTLVEIAPPFEVLSAGDASITELTLYRSDLLRQRAEYHVLARHSLAGPSKG